MPQKTLEKSKVFRFYQFLKILIQTHFSRIKNLVIEHKKSQPSQTRIML
jgi:hypothetical protein